MQLDLFVKLKYQPNNKTLKHYLLVLNILCDSYFLTSITMPDPQTSDMRHMPKVNYVITLSGISSI